MYFTVGHPLGYPLNFPKGYKSNSPTNHPICLFEVGNKIIELSLDEVTFWSAIKHDTKLKETHVHLQKNLKSCLQKGVLLHENTEIEMFRTLKNYRIARQGGGNILESRSILLGENAFSISKISNYIWYFSNGLRNVAEVFEICNSSLNQQLTIIKFLEELEKLNGGFVFLL